MENNAELLLAFGRLEGKVDALIATETSRNEALSKQDERLRQVEQSRSAMLGAVAILATAVSALVAWMTT